MNVIGNIDMLGWVTAACALLGAFLIMFQAIRTLGQYEQRLVAVEKTMGPDFQVRKGRDDERWTNLFARLDSFEERLERIENNGNGKGSHAQPPPVAGTR